MKAVFPKLLVALTGILYPVCIFCQQPTPSPTPDESIKINTEEVRLNVMAQNAYGRFVSTLKPDDLLVVEEGTPQTITSMRRLPANVLLVLDTGGDLNLVKSTELTRLTAKIAVNNLAREDSVSVIQVGDKVETLADWSSNREAVFAGLDKKLFGSKRVRLADGLKAAVDLFASKPLENRHIVLISDGLDTVATEAALRQSMDDLQAANITIHVISYTGLESAAARKSGKVVRMGKGDTKPRISQDRFEEMLMGMPVPPDPKLAAKAREFLRTMNSSQRLLTVELDRPRIANMQNKQKIENESETKLQTAADDSGGMFQAPEEAETMFTFAADVARAIDSQYVITYNPTVPIDPSHPPIRKVRVSSHCDGVTIRSRQKLVVRK